jgi:hypothetical protein
MTHTMFPLLATQLNHDISKEQRSICTVTQSNRFNVSARTETSQPNVN